MSEKNLLSVSQVETTIATQIEKLRKEYNIGKYPDTVEKKCNECDIENALFADDNGFRHEQIKTTALGIPEPFHRACLIGCKTTIGPRWYIVDPTYGQFFENEIFKDYMLNNHKQFSLELLEKGYIEFTLPNIVAYINGFALSDAYTTDITLREVYSKLEGLLLSTNIIKKENHKNYQELVKLLYLKQDFLNKNKINSAQISNQQPRK